jgi:hypothetical protein
VEPNYRRIGGGGGMEPNFRRRVGGWSQIIAREEGAGAKSQEGRLAVEPNYRRGGGGWSQIIAREAVVEAKLK